LLLAAVVGVGGGLVAGWGLGQLDQTEAAAGGTASPLPASSPSVSDSTPSSCSKMALVAVDSVASCSARRRCMTEVTSAKSDGAACA